MNAALFQAPKTTVPGGFPLVGHLPAFLRDKIGFLSRCAATGGGAVELNIGGPVFLLTSPEDIKHVLVVNQADYEKSPRIIQGVGKRLFGDALIALPNETHHERRKILQPLFHRGAVERFGAVMIERATDRVAAWRDGDEFDLASEMMDLSRRIAVEAFSGLRDAESVAVLSELLEMRRRYVEFVFGSPLPFAERWPLPINRRFRQAERRLRRIVDELIASQRRGDHSEPNLAGMLIRASGQTERPLTDAQIRDEFMTVATAGYETLGPTLTWTLHAVSRNPEVERRLRDELREVLADGPPTVEDVPKLSYTAKVVAESMRLFPPTWLFVRVARRADRLPSGVRVPGGARLYLCPYVTHRDPRWFPDPERFDPERFDEAAKANRPKFAYFPFGGGERGCIGESFALTEAVLTTACVLQRFRLVTNHGPEVPLEAGLTLRPRRGLRVRCLSLDRERFQARDESSIVFSVVVPTYNRPRKLAALLESLTRLDYPPKRFEVIVVDDGGDAKPDAVVAAFRDRLDVVLLTAGHGGPAKARQAGIDRARGRYLAFTDDDCLPAPNWLNKLEAEFRVRPRTTAVGGRVVNALAENPYSTASQLLCDYLCLRFNADSEAARFCTTNNLAFSREDFQAVGGLDTAWRIAGGEDRDLCDRWLRGQNGLVYRSDIVVRHFHNLTLRSFWRQHFNYGRGALRFHRVRAERERKRFRLEIPSFYAGLLLFPFSRMRWARAVVTAALFVVSQAATAAGFLWEMASGNPDSMPPLDSVRARTNSKH